MRSASRNVLVMTVTVLEAGLLALAACNMPTATPDEDALEARPLCILADLGAPRIVYPGDYSIVLEMSPTFQWEPQTSCDPEGYRIQVTTYGGYDYGELYAGESGGGESTWSVNTPLKPATNYEWRVAAIAADKVGPFSESFRFWTGPVCEASTLAAPILNAPANGTVIAEEYAILDWEYPDPCVPEDYLVELMTTSDFSGTNQMSEEVVAPADEQVSFSSLEDCTTYYWRVAAIVGTTMGPYSEVRELRTNFTGSCDGSAIETTSP